MARARGYGYNSAVKRVLAVAVLALMWPAAGAWGGEAHQGSEWHFRPTGAKPTNELAKLEANSDLKGWQAVSLPHSFDHIQRANNVYGWYVRRLRVPAAYRGHDLMLDLGTIDDADKTYLNGQVVGQMGSFQVQTQSAWNRDRRYIAPARVVRHDGANVLAVQVKDFTGLGGLMSIPTLGVILPKRRVARFHPGDVRPEDASRPDYEDKGWREIPLPDVQFDKRVPKNPGYGWYRVRFDLPVGLKKRDLLLDLGAVYDAAACYLNGKLIGRAGKLPADFFPQTAGRFRCVAPAGLLRPKDNLLAIRAYNVAEFGGVVGLPCVSFEIQEKMGLFGSTVKEWVRALGAQLKGAEQAALAQELSEYLVGSRRLDQAIALCEAAARAAAPGSAMRQKALGRIVYALWLQGKPGKAWEAFQELDFTRSGRPKHSCRK